MTYKYLNGLVIPVGSLPDATISSKGIVQLSGDLDGYGTSATTPTIGQLTGLSNAVTIVSGTNFKVAGSSLSFNDNGSVTRLSLETVHGRLTAGGGGTDFKAVIGPMSGAETTNSAVYLLPSASALGSNYIIGSDGSNATLNAPAGGGYLTFYSGGVTLLSTWTPTALGLNSLAQIIWAAGIVSPTLTQSAQTSNVANNNITISAQAPWNNVGNTFNNAGDVIVNTPASVNASATKMGGFLVEYASTPAVRMGAYQSSTTFASIWFADGGSATTTNWGFLGNQSVTWLNAPTNVGTVGFAVGGSSSQSMVFSGTTAALLQFGAGATSGITINQVTAANNVTAAPFKISPQGPGGGTSLNPGDLILEIPKSISANTFYGGVRIQQADPTTPITMIRMGMYGGPLTQYAGIWFVDAGAPSANNFSFLGNQSFTYLNVASGGQLALTIAGTSSNGINISGTSTCDVSYGTAVSTAHFGTNANAAHLILRAGNTVSILDGYAPGNTAGTGNLSIIGSIQYTYRTSAVSFAVDTTTTDTFIRLTATQTVTLPTPTVGRILEFLVDLTGVSDSTITFARHAAENINGAAANFVIGPFVAGSMNRLLCRSDGTNWFIAG